MNETIDQARLQRSVVRRIKGGATTMEVMHWLRKRHGVEGADAQALLKVAGRERNKVIRKQAALGILLCLMGLIAPLAVVIGSAVTLGGVSVGLLYYLPISAISAVFLVRYIRRFFKAGEEAAVGWEL
jgi:hypothetical protein